MLKVETLSNGLKLLVFPMTNTEACTLLLLVRTGSKYETKNLNGISHLLEHLLFRGTKNWPDPSAIARELDAVGGLYNAFTDKEMLGVWIKTDSKDLCLTSKILKDMTSCPLFEEKEILKEKKVIAEEINMRQDTAQIMVLDLWEKLLYGNQPAGWEVIGTKSSLDAISQNDLFRHLKDFFVSRNAVLVLAGKVSEKQVRDVKALFSDLKDSSVKKKPLVRENQSKPEILLQFKQTDQTHICLGVRGFGVFSRERYVLAVLATILGGMMSSRLFEEIRERRGLAYYLRTTSEHYTDTGFLTTHAGLSNSKVAEAVEIICQEYRKIKLQKISQKELTKAKENLRGHLFLGLETSDEFASFYGVQKIMEREVLTPEQEWQNIAKVSQNDILKVAKQVFRPNRLNLAIIGPHKSLSLIHI